ncbi:flagellar biosynthetic protein FliO [Polycladidibacter hongkongensis]|uniref:flagellar biosynthetic protein FliO n=1 Tax=Polycladidibacter hongkongensis TaxID=1647556 RepID=UPI00082E15F7|nr:flagellar biosynthetic protein FliO [Pseudovibrio hongkongensis]
MADWLMEFIGLSEPVANILGAIIGLALVIGLMGLCYAVLKPFIKTNYKGYRNRQPRIAIMDVTELDARRRLLLVRRDNVEHLILVGGQNDLVVEQNILRAMPQGQTQRNQTLQQGQQATQAAAITQPQAVAQSNQAVAQPQAAPTTQAAPMQQEHALHASAPQPTATQPQQQIAQPAAQPSTPSATRQQRASADYQRHLAASRERLRKAEATVKANGTNSSVANGGVHVTEAQRQAQQVAAARALAASRASVSPPSAGPAARIVAAQQEKQRQDEAAQSEVVADTAALAKDQTKPVEETVPTLKLASSLEEALSPEVTTSTQSPEAKEPDATPTNADKKPENAENVHQLDLEAAIQETVAKASNSDENPTQEDKVEAPAAADDATAESKGEKSKNPIPAEALDKEMADLLSELKPA